ncbi:WDR62 [Cordylochernes scorpioides]|uniref:WDR62 n=1 Tax=Cordylochernes scorpioides TaxID=51811 RepID=A0ABY6K5D8_9ARAC|nr:WDR62 [Cordylochernes scorpioides]
MSGEEAWDKRKVQLERVLGLTVSNGSALDCDPTSGTLAYTAGCVAVLSSPKKPKQTHLVVDSKRTLTCLTFSSDGQYLATGECGGHMSCLRVWSVPEQLQLVEFTCHKFGINCVAFSPNGKYVVSVGSQHDMTLNVWEWQSKLKIASSKVSTKVKDLSFSASGSYFVTVGNHHVKFWYMEYSRTAKAMIIMTKVCEQYKPTEGMPLMGRSAILGDQRANYFCAVGCGKGSVADSTFAVTKSGLLCEFNSRRLLDKWVELKTTSAYSLCVGENMLAVGCADGIVRCFSPTDLHFLCTLPRPHLLGVDVAQAISAASNKSSGGANKYPDTLAVTLDETNKKVGCRSMETTNVKLQVTCVYADHSLYTWDVRDPKKVGKAQSYLYHSACIWGVEVYPDDGGLLPPGTFLTCSSDDTIRIWNLEPTHAQKNVYSTNASDFVIKTGSTTQWQADLAPKEMAASDMRNKLHELIKILYTDPDLAYLCDVHPSKSTIHGNCHHVHPPCRVAGEDKLDTVFDGKNGVRCLRISPDGLHLASGDRSGNIRIYDLRYMEMLFKIEAHDAEVLSLEYSKHSGGMPKRDAGAGRSKKYLCSASRDRLIHIFDANQEYGFLQTLDDHTSSVTAAKFLQSDGQLQLVSCGADKAIIFRKAQFIPQLRLVREHQVVGKSTLYDMEADPSQKMVLAACQDHSVRVFCASSGRQRRCFRGSLGEDGTLIKVSYRDLTDISSQQPKPCHIGLMSIVVLDPTGTYIATSSTDKNVYIFDYESGQCVAAMAGHSELVTGLKFTSSGKHIISVSGDGCIFVWKLPTAMTQNMAKQSLISSPSKTWQTTRKNAIAVAEPIQKQREPTESGYQFNLGQLPAWAKKQMAAETPSRDNSPNSHPPIPPRGRWAQRIDGQGLVVKSYLNSDSIIPFPPSGQNAQTLSADSPVSRVRHPTDSSSTTSSLRLEEDLEAEDERSDTSDHKGLTIEPDLSSR